MLQIHVPIHVELAFETFTAKGALDSFLPSRALVGLLVMIHAFMRVQWAILWKLVDMRAI